MKKTCIIYSNQNISDVRNAIVSSDIRLMGYEYRPVVNRQEPLIITLSPELDQFFSANLGVPIVEIVLQEEGENTKLFLTFKKTKHLYFFNVIAHLASLMGTLVILKNANLTFPEKLVIIPYLVYFIEKAIIWKKGGFIKKKGDVKVEFPLITIILAVIGFAIALILRNPWMSFMLAIAFLFTTMGNLLTKSTHRSAISFAIRKIAELVNGTVIAKNI